MAAGPDDTGVIVSFNSEAEDINDSLLIPEGTKTLAINPLNWKTDSTPADKSMNLGACFTDYSGAITTEIPGLTGAYLDPQGFPSLRTASTTFTIINSFTGIWKKMWESGWRRF